MRLVFVLYLGQATFEFISTLLGIGIKSKPTCLKYSSRKENQIENISLRKETSYSNKTKHETGKLSARVSHQMTQEPVYNHYCSRPIRVELHATEDCLIT